MNYKTIYLALIVILLSCQSQSQEQLKLNVYYPNVSGELIEHHHFSLDYNEYHEQANWVYYTIEPAYLSGSAVRKNKFKPDPKVSTESAQLSDYKKSGYDRGHLCPSADMKLDQLCNDETFYMSNMTPQLACLNRQTWRELESNVRNIARVEGKLIVVTGPILPKKGKNREVIGTNEVTIPKAFYKVLFSPNSAKMIAYVMKHNCTCELEIISVDKLEEKTGIDFFESMPDKLENELEKKSTW